MRVDAVNQDSYVTGAARRCILKAIRWSISVDVSRFQSHPSFIRPTVSPSFAGRRSVRQSVWDGGIYCPIVKLCRRRRRIDRVFRKHRFFGETIVDPAADFRNPNRFLPGRPRQSPPPPSKWMSEWPSNLSYPSGPRPAGQAERARERRHKCKRWFRDVGGIYLVQGTRNKRTKSSPMWTYIYSTCLALYSSYRVVSFLAHGGAWSFSPSIDMKLYLYFCILTLDNKLRFKSKQYETEFRTHPVVAAGTKTDWDEKRNEK